MRAPPRTLWLAAALFGAIGCFIQTDEFAGHECRSDSDCFVDYRCVKVEGTKKNVCEVIYPLVKDAGQSDGGRPPVYYCGEVQQILTTYCAQCHGEDRDASCQDFRLDLYDTDSTGAPGAGSQGLPAKISAQIAIGAMPPLKGFDGGCVVVTQDYPEPDAGESDLVLAWVRTGAHNCADAGP